MNRTIVCALTLAGAFAAFAYDPNGGIVEKKTAIPSKQICIADKQKIIAPEQMKALVKDARLNASLPFLLDAPKAPATIELKESGADPAMALYPEEYRAIINVTALAADNAASTTVVARVEKEVIRAGWFLMGAGQGPNDCILRPVRGLKDLDAMMVDRPSPEAFVHCRAAKKIGVKPIQWITYRHACKLGIANPPVTEDEKIVWNEIHATPTKPIIIKPETKKVE